MQKIIFFILAILLSAGLASAETIQIGSFNIQYLGDGIDDQHPRDDFDLNKLAQIIDLLDIEMLVVAEVENKAVLDKLVEKLPKDEQRNAI